MATQEADHRPPRYIEEIDGEEVVVYRASSLGYCPRAIVATASGLTAVNPPAWLAQAYTEGVESEPLILSMYQEKTGVVIEATQYEVELDLGRIEGRQVVIRGHIDAIIDGGEPVEIKKVSHLSWDTAIKQGVESNVLYPWQASVYYFAMGTGALDFVQGRYKDGQITDINVINLIDPPIPLAAIYDKVKKCERWINDTHYMDVPCGPVIYPCGWHYLHDEDADEWPVRKDMEPWLLGEVQQLAQWQDQKREHQRRVKELDTNIKAVDATLRNWLDANGEGGAEKSIVEVNGTEYVLVRTKYDRKEYVVPAATVDYISAEGKESKEERNRTRAAKAAATRADNAAKKRGQTEALS